METGRERGERGDTLIEILVAIGIIGIAVAALLGGLATSISSSGLHRQQADGGLVLVQVLEGLKSSPYRADCTAYPSPAVPAGWTVSIDERYWKTDKFSAGGCTPGFDLDEASQELIVRVSNTPGGGNVTLTETVIKRQPAPATTTTSTSLPRAG